MKAGNHVGLSEEMLDGLQSSQIAFLHESWE